MIKTYIDDTDGKIYEEEIVGSDLDEIIEPGLYVLSHYWTEADPNQYTLRIVNAMPLKEVVRRLEIDFEPDKAEVLILSEPDIATLSTDETKVNYQGEVIRAFEDRLGKGWSWSGGSAPSLNDAIDEISNLADC